MKNIGRNIIVDLTMCIVCIISALTLIGLLWIPFLLEGWGNVRIDESEN